MNIQQVINLLLDGDTDRAIVILLREQHKQRDLAKADPWDEVAAKQRAIAKVKELPPITPLGDRRVTAPSMRCPLCKAKPGKPCVKISDRGLPGVEMGEPLAGGSYHNARIQRAKEASS